MTSRDGSLTGGGTSARIHEIRVIFGDTDQMGVVYYANYLRYFESARAAYWRELGRTYHDLVAWDVALPVVEASCQYRRSSHYEDVLHVETWISELRQASMRFSYRITREAVLIAEGMTRHAIVGSNGRPRAAPPQLLASIPPVPPKPA